MLAGPNRHFRRGFLCADLDPFWRINCQQYFVLQNIYDGHEDFAIDDNSFVLGLDKNLHGLAPVDLMFTDENVE